MAGTAAENGWVPWSVVRRAIGGVVEIPRTAGLMVLGAGVRASSGRRFITPSGDPLDDVSHRRLHLVGQFGRRFLLR